MQRTFYITPTPSQSLFIVLIWILLQHSPTHFNHFYLFDSTHSNHNHSHHNHSNHNHSPTFTDVAPSQNWNSPHLVNIHNPLYDNLSLSHLSTRHFDTQSSTQNHPLSHPIYVIFSAHSTTTSSLSPQHNIFPLPLTYAPHLQRTLYPIQCPSYGLLPNRYHFVLHMFGLSYQQ